MPSIQSILFTVIAITAIWAITHYCISLYLNGGKREKNSRKLYKKPKDKDKHTPSI